MSLFSNEAPKLGASATIGGYMAFPFEIISLPITASSVSQDVFIARDIFGLAGGSAVYQVISANVTFGTASTSGTADVVKMTGTTAVGSGTTVLTGTMSLAGTANTPVKGTLASPAVTLADGDRLGVKLGGTMTSLANGLVQIVLQRIA